MYFCVVFERVANRYYLLVSSRHPIQNQCNEIRESAKPLTRLAPSQATAFIRSVSLTSFWEVRYFQRNVHRIISLDNIHSSLRPIFCLLSFVKRSYSEVADLMSELYGLVLCKVRGDYQERRQKCYFYIILQSENTKSIHYNKVGW